NATGAGIRKGIFLTIIAVLLLSFMLIAVGLWSSVEDARESRIPEKIKTDSMAQVVFQLSNAKLNRFVNISGYYALNRLANYSISNPINQGTDLEKTGNINKSIYDLMVYGSTDAGGSFHPNLTYSTNLEKQYTLDNWIGQLKASADVMGFDFEMGNITNFSFNQTTAWDVQVQFDTNVSIKDKQSTMKLAKSLHVNTTFSILGMPDPLLTKELYPAGNYSKIIFANQDASHRLDSDYSASQIGFGQNGKGWASGLVTTVANITADTSTENNVYVLVMAYPEKADGSPDDAKFTEIINTMSPQISGIVITNLKQNITTAAMPDANGCLWRETTDLNGAVRYKSKVDANGNHAACPTTIALLYDSGYPTIGFAFSPAIPAGAQIAFANYPGSGTPGVEPFEHTDYHALYDITMLRKMMSCGLYAQPNPSEGPQAPSFLQRMLKDGETLKSKNFGIESFIISQWAGGSSDPDFATTNAYSRLDMNYYSGIDGDRIKGGSGCKTKEMCLESSAPGPTIPLGTFKLDYNASIRYGVKGL
ncbi:MAG TPA: hypothetical protein PLO51_04220, partial [Candidatus Micrarchaeota archaeon]|nr:hypothetical protein [Candidatus Micrarchaeota archaeon]